MDRVSLRLVNPQQAKPLVDRLWMTLKASLLAGHVITVEARPEKRSDAQNRMMWAALGDIAKSVVWHGRKLRPEDWKDVLTASLRRQDVVPGLDGSGFVVLGQRTSKMTKKELAEVIDLAHAFGDSKGVPWSPQALGRECGES